MVPIYLCLFLQDNEQHIVIARASYCKMYLQLVTLTLGSSMSCPDGKGALQTAVSLIMQGQVTLLFPKDDIILVMLGIPTQYHFLLHIRVLTTISRNGNRESIGMCTFHLHAVKPFPDLLVVQKSTDSRGVV